MPSSESEAPRTTRKRQRTTRADADADADDSRKVRGRPRVNTQDETAADRRRTQIRLAQRAYRQRKETTIVSLNKQVEDLQKTIDEMNKTFLHFNDQVISSGILSTSPHLARELKSATEKFIALARTASQVSDEEEQEHSPMQDEPADKARRSTSHDTNPSIQHQDLNPNPGYPQPFQSDSSPELEDPVSAFGYASALVHKNSEPLLPWTIEHTSAITIPPTAAAATTTTVNSTMDLWMTMTEESSTLPFGLLDASMSPPSDDFSRNPDQLTEEALSIFSSGPRAPYTYSFQEKTFARRLHRAAIERAFHLISQKPNHPVLQNHVLKLSRMFKTTDQIHARFQQILQRGVEDSLDFHSTPFVHLGGAGRHYPARDASGNIKPLPNSFNIRRIGPASVLENTQNPSMTIELDCDISEFSGEWFDAHDVEGYLQDKGVRIDPQVSFAEVEVLADPLPLDMTMGPNMAGRNNSVDSVSDLTNSRTVETNSRPRTPDFWASLADQIPDVSELDSYVFSGPENAGVPRQHAVQPQEDYFGQLALDPSLGFLETEGLQVHQERRTVTVDVTKFISELVKRGVCLGRAPGFRRKDVDVAFNAAIISAF